ncbi:MAG: alpha/beta hydrolase [Pseudomonadales bacterium]
MTYRRGAVSFEPETLAAGLSSFAPAAAITGDPAAGYRRYYHLDFLSNGQPVRHHIGVVRSGAHRIVAQLFSQTAARGTVVVCHGYYDHVGLYGHLIGFLLDAGYDVLTFDQPGHGLSSGPRATIGSFDEYVAALADTLAAAGDRLVRPWHIVGQSMGGAVTMEYLVQHGTRDFGRVALLAPLIRPANWGRSRIVYEIARRTITERPRVLTPNAENPEFLELLAVDPLSPRTLPVAWVTAMVAWMTRFERYGELPFRPLVVQGHADQTVGWKRNLRTLRRMTEPEVLEIPAARHHLVNESEDIRRQMFEWLAPRFLD